MTLRGRQARFLIAILLSWSTGRAYLLWPTVSVVVRGALAPDAARVAVAPKTPVKPPAPGADTPHVARMARLALADPPLTNIEIAPLAAPARANRVPTPRRPFAEPPTPAPAALFPSEHSQRNHIEAQAYLFWRPGGSGASLAQHGELGGSQFAARIAIPLGHGLSATARIYAPLEHKGAEAAFGIDWHPLPHLPIRISVERRQRLDVLGRSAWSAYAAGGFWRGGGPGRPVIDGYAQAGVVGTQRRDLFIDGALRLGYQLPTHGPAVTVGAGLWGAAQPQVSRLDVGPRIAAVVPVNHHNLTVALDGRFRTAGNAAPGSGAALTIAADF